MEKSKFYHTELWRYPIVFGFVFLMVLDLQLHIQDKADVHI